MLPDAIAGVINNVSLRTYSVTHTNQKHTHTHTPIHYRYLKAGSSLLHLGGGDENAFLLLKSFWKRVGGILYHCKVGTERLFFSNPRANLVPCNCLHGCHSHMTGISHGSCLVTHYIFLIGRPDAAATTKYPIGWYFWPSTTWSVDSLC